jgi:dihydropteroate synthase
MKNTININGKLLSFDEPKIMGIINITPDSFYKDSRFNLGEESFLPKAEKMISDGCDIFDVGGYSTRPNATEITINEEIERIRKPVELLKKNFPDMPISIDTFRVEVAKAALDEGANIINDVSGGNLDEKMFDFVISKNIPYILMHMRGNPNTMQNLNNYENLLKDIFIEIISKANKLKAQGVKDVIIDLGFGFSKDINQNYELLKNISLFETDYYPTLMGVSRKSMLYKLLETTPEDVLPETSALHLFGLLQNVGILRVHDVKAAKRIIKLKSQFLP